MTVDIIVTPQEKTIIENLTLLKVDHIVQPLDIGDIHIQKNNKVEIIIERKAKKDLLQSIVNSNRYNDQKRRMRETGIPFHNIIYLIEHFDEHPIAWSAITNTYYRDNMSIMMTKNSKQSALWLSYMKKTMEKHTPGERDEEMSQVFIDKKKKSISEHDWFMHSLTLIKGVSVSIAKEIVKKYPTYQDLYSEYKQNGPNALCNLKINGRCYPKITQRISKCIFHIE